MTNPTKTTCRRKIMETVRNSINLKFKPKDCCNECGYVCYCETHPKGEPMCGRGEDCPCHSKPQEEVKCTLFTPSDKCETCGVEAGEHTPEIQRAYERGQEDEAIEWQKNIKEDIAEALASERSRIAELVEGMIDELDKEGDAERIESLEDVLDILK